MVSRPCAQELILKEEGRPRKIKSISTPASTGSYIKSSDWKRSWFSFYYALVVSSLTLSVKIETNKLSALPTRQQIMQGTARPRQGQDSVLSAGLPDTPSTTGPSPCISYSKHLRYTLSPYLLYAFRMQYENWVWRLEILLPSVLPPPSSFALMP